LLEEFLRDGEFAIVLLSAVALHGNGTPVLVPTECNDGSKRVPEVFSIQCEAPREFVLVDSEPEVECLGEFARVSFVDEIVDGIVARHDESPVFIAHGESNGLALGLAQGTAALPNGFDVGRPREQTVGDESEYGYFGVTPR